MMPLLAALEIGEGASAVMNNLVRAHQQLVHALVHLELLELLARVLLLAQAVALPDVVEEVGGVDGVDQLSGMA